jgi:hypothetical protein
MPHMRVLVSRIPQAGHLMPLMPPAEALATPSYRGAAERLAGEIAAMPTPAQTAATIAQEIGRATRDRGCPPSR